MNVGIVSIWCNRGQATVARHVRDIFDGLGHRTFVLARPQQFAPHSFIKTVYLITRTCLRYAWKFIRYALIIIVGGTFWAVFMSFKFIHIVARSMTKMLPYLLKPHKVTTHKIKVELQEIHAWLNGLVEDFHQKRHYSHEKAAYIRQRFLEDINKFVTRYRNSKDPGWTIADFSVWEQKNVTHASNHTIHLKEYVSWVKENDIHVVFCDQNYQFDELAKLRSMGVKVIGRFVWEKFSGKHVDSAKKAYDIIYSLTRSEQERYREMGIESPKLDWGCHPEITSITAEKPSDEIRIIFPASGLRKPVAQAIEAFGRAKLPDNVKLILKSQENRTGIDTGGYDVDADPRIVWENRDLDFEEYHKLFASCHICFCPSKWEGLGLHLYEAIAHGVATITNDIPPMNEVIEDGTSGILVKSIKDGDTPSGIQAYMPEPDDLVRALEEATRPDVLDSLLEGTIRRRESMPWQRTIEQFRKLLEA
ncbi:MAG: glycosyltransferase family 4 protein [Thermodesulfovibrionales bacterium]|nr:glycosyltransferase family 4 protein [Thermodesulfovibrionales bacterium]